jgi:hypothetical protein
MRILTKKLFPVVVALTLTVSGCATLDLSTPENNLASLYRAIANKDAKSYVECFYVASSMEDALRAAQNMFEQVTVIDHKLVKTEELTQHYSNLTVLEVSKREDGQRYASTFTVRYVKIKNRWKILNVENIETVRVDKGEK